MRPARCVPAAGGGVSGCQSSSSGLLVWCAGRAGNCWPRPVLNWLTSGPGPARTVAAGVVTAPDGRSGSSAQLQGDRQSDLGGDEGDHGPDRAVSGLAGDEREGHHVGDVDAETGAADRGGQLAKVAYRIGITDQLPQTQPQMGPPGWTASKERRSGADTEYLPTTWSRPFTRFRCRMLRRAGSRRRAAGPGVAPRRAARRRVGWPPPGAPVPRAGRVRAPVRRGRR